MVGIDYHTEHERNEPFIPVQIEEQAEHYRDGEVRCG